MLVLNLFNCVINHLLSVDLLKKTFYQTKEHNITLSKFHATAIYDINEYDSFYRFLTLKLMRSLILYYSDRLIMSFAKSAKLIFN